MQAFKPVQATETQAEHETRDLYLLTSAAKLKVCVVATITIVSIMIQLGPRRDANSVNHLCSVQTNQFTTSAEMGRLTK